MSTPALRILLFTLFIPCFVHAQHPCAMPDVNAQGDAEAFFNAGVLAFRDQGLHLNTDVHCLPVVVHIVNDPAFPVLRVQQQLERTNEHLRRTHIDAVHTRPAFVPNATDSHIELRLASVAPDGTPFSGLHHIDVPGFHIGMAPAVIADHLFDRSRYVNVWVFPGLTNAWAVFPWDATDTNDGIVVPPEHLGYELGGNDPDAQGGKIFTHELGHYLGLYHTFHGWQNLGDCDDSACDFTGDRCCDTPKDWRVFPIPGEECWFETLFCDDGGTIVTNDENYMFYNPDHCLNMFSHDQRIRMRACLHDLRQSLTTAATHASTGISCLSVGFDDDASVYTGERLVVFPNPTDGIIYLRVPSGIRGPLQFRVLDATGRLVLREVLQRTGPDAPLRSDVGKLPPGIYSVELVGASWRAVERVVRW